MCNAEECPKCGQKPAIECHEKLHWAICGCGKVGGYALTEEGAIEEWNDHIDELVNPENEDDWNLIS